MRSNIVRAYWENFITDMCQLQVGTERYLGAAGRCDTPTDRHVTWEGVYPPEWKDTQEGIYPPKWIIIQGK
jgi:hypothetical protein